ncbi:MAG: hypothetical protein IH830_05090 [Planctomycetes bacterium]|nr:hypothetical protein [Planctomycetota bacterium]
MFSKSLLVRNGLPFVAIAAMLTWAETANAGLVIDPVGNAILGLETKLALNDDGSPNDLLFVTNVYVRFTEADDRFLTIAFAQIYTRNGSDFYQHPAGGDTAPSEALVGMFPSLAFDTFVTFGVKTNDGSDTTATDPAYADLGNKIVGGWYANPDSGQGDAGNYPLNPDGTYWILIAQLTIDNKPGNGVVGSMLVFWQEFPGAPLLYNEANFPISPSPGALALLGLAGLMGVRRRRD